MQEECFSCRKPKAISHCGICHEPLCKNCAQFLEASTFSFRQTVPEELSHTYYCSPCYNEKIEPALEAYNEVMVRARAVYFFFTTQKKNFVPVIKRARESIHVEGCVDRDETILRLAFRAAEDGYNGIIQGEVSSKKVRDEGYQKSVWQGTGVPAHLDEIKLERSAENH